MSDTLTPEERAYLIEYCESVVQCREAMADDTDATADPEYEARLRMQASAHRKMIEMLKGGEG